MTATLKHPPVCAKACHSGAIFMKFGRAPATRWMRGRLVITPDRSGRASSRSGDVEEKVADLVHLLRRKLRIHGKAQDPAGDAIRHRQVRPCARQTGESGL